MLSFVQDSSTSHIPPLSLHDALPILRQSLSGNARETGRVRRPHGAVGGGRPAGHRRRSEEHTSELQSRGHLVCRLLLEKKKLKKQGKYRNEGYNNHGNKEDSLVTQAR